MLRRLTTTTKPLGFKNNLIGQNIQNLTNSQLIYDNSSKNIGTNNIAKKNYSSIIPDNKQINKNQHIRKYQCDADSYDFYQSDKMIG